MRTAKHMHYLLSEGCTNELDVNACLLALHSRGRYVLFGETQEETRCLLADDLGGGVLAELLRSMRPVVVDTGPDCYVFWEL